jgi:hypothetical protein
MHDNDPFYLHLEQLVICRDLLISESIAKQRMALILLDSLADALIHNRLHRAYDAWEEVWYTPNPSFPKSIRRQARLNFEERLSIAQQTFDDLGSRGRHPLVTRIEAAVLSIGHSYRNAVYHRDTHNPAVLPPLCRLMFKAVRAAYARSHDWGLMIQDASAINDLVGHEVINPTGGWITRGDASKAVVAKLTEGLEVDALQLAEQLSEDLTARMDELEEWIGFLPIPRDRLDELLAEYEFGAKFGSDDELVALEAARRALIHSSIHDPRHEPDLENLRQDLRLAESRILDRVAELRNSAGPATTSLADLEKVRMVHEKISASVDSTEILTLYREADVLLTPLETYIGEAAEAWDREIQMQIDIARGK